jgi:hypothetical protein
VGTAALPVFSLSSAFGNIGGAPVRVLGAGPESLS